MRPIGMERRNASRSFSGLAAASVTVARSAVSVGPGQTTLKVMPLWECSRAIVLEKATIPALHAAYTASPDEPTRAASDEMLTTRPPPRSTMAGSTAWCMLSAPTKLMSIRRDQSSGWVSRNGTNRSQPALLTRTSIGPRSETVRSTAASTVDRSVMSHAIARARRPSAPSVSATAFAAPSFRSRTATAAPSAAKCRQRALPIPPPPPVTITVLPSNLLTGLSFSRCIRCSMILS